MLTIILGAGRVFILSRLFSLTIVLVVTPLGSINTISHCHIHLQIGTIHTGTFLGSSRVASVLLLSMHCLSAKRFRHLRRRLGVVLAVVAGTDDRQQVVFQGHQPHNDTKQRRRNQPTRPLHSFWKLCGHSSSNHKYQKGENVVAVAFSPHFRTPRIR